MAGRRLSFLDFGGRGRPLPALHGHFGEGCTFTHLARELGDSWRVVALDQRGHGRSDRPEDIGAEVDDDLSFALCRPHRAATRSGLLEGLDPSAAYLMDAVREYPDGWGLAFDPQGMNASQQLLNGDHWDDWLAGDCPALLVRGSRSSVLSAEHARSMAARRPRTRLVELPAGHTVHATVPMEFAVAVVEFLDTL